jgi:hypothetical protein
MIGDVIKGLPPSRLGVKEVLVGGFRATLVPELVARL